MTEEAKMVAVRYPEEKEANELDSEKRNLCSCSQLGVTTGVARESSSHLHKFLGENFQISEQKWEDSDKPGTYHQDMVEMDRTGQVICPCQSMNFVWNNY